MKASRKAAKRSRSKPPVVGRGPSLRTTQNSRKSSQAEAPLVEAAVQMDQPVDELSGMRRKIHILKMIVSSLIGQTTSTLARKEQLLEEATDALRKREAELLLKLCNANLQVAKTTRLYAELEQKYAENIGERNSENDSHALS